MVAGIARAVKGFWDNLVDGAAFAAVGYLAGHTVNWLVKSPSISPLFKTTDQIDPISGTQCCILFFGIDRMAKMILGSVLGSGEVNRPVYSVLRMGLSGYAAIHVLNRISPWIKCASVEAKMGGAVLVTAVVIYSQMLMHIAAFNQHYGDGSSYQDLDYRI